jgi:hypothetical protein
MEDEDLITQKKLDIILNALTILLVSGTGSSSRQQEKILFFKEYISSFIH